VYYVLLQNQLLLQSSPYIVQMDHDVRKKLRNANDMQDSRRLWKADNGACFWVMFVKWKA